MKRSLTIPFCLLFCLAVSIATAKTENTFTLIDAAHDSELVGGSINKAKGDTFSVYFENFEAGEAGWTTHDLTEGEAQWQTSTFNAADLDPSVPDNHAWWCGEYFTPCDETDLDGGYGPNYNSVLSWAGDLVNPGVAVEVHISADMNYDLELGYDFLYLECSTSAGWTEIYQWNGSESGIHISESVLLNASDYVDGQVQLRWRVASDSAWDAADCLFPNNGAAQIDNITVTFDQGSGPVQIGETESCESGFDTAWVPETMPGVGDFAQLMSAVPDLDPCPNNLNDSTRWVFVDDGVIVPGTGGYTGEYGPGAENYVVNPVGGLLGPDYHIHNEIWSPAIPWPSSSFGLGAIFSFDWYLDMCVNPDCSGIFATWGVRSTDDPAAMDPNTDPEKWTEWHNNNIVYYGGPYNQQMSFDISGYLVENCQAVQVSLGVWEAGAAWGITGTNSTPAPYFDNVKLFCYENGPYRISARANDLAQDSVTGSADGDDFSAHTLRFDSARNLIDPSLGFVPGDSLVVTVTPLNPVSTDPVGVNMYYRLEANPTYNPYRNSGLPNEGHITCESADGVIFSADPPDAGFLYPGDVLHYCFVAHDGVGNLTILPTDTTGFSNFSLTCPYVREFTWRGLPTRATDMSQPKTLMWDDSGFSEAAGAWYNALISSGLMPGIGFDTFRTTAPRYNGGNGLTSWATDVLNGYDTILYSGGNNSNEPLGYSDVYALDQFLRLGEKCVIISGNHAVSALSFISTGDAFLSDWLGVSSSSDDVEATIGSGELSVLAIAGNPIFDDDARWTADGSDCYVTFDAVTVTDATPLAEFESPGAYPFTAASRNEVAESSATAFVFPYDLSYVADSAKAGDKDFAVMSAILEKIFISLDYGPVANLLQACEISSSNGGVDAQWQVSVPARAADFRLIASIDSRSWTVAKVVQSGAGFTARDESPSLQAGETFTYTLFYRSADDRWREIHSTDVEIASMPGVTMLRGAHPNPFNPSTEIAFSVNRPQTVNVSIYDVTGRRVIELVHGNVGTGNHTVIWHGDDADGRRTSSGTYFVRMESKDGIESQKIMLVK